LFIKFGFFVGLGFIVFGNVLPKTREGAVCECLGFVLLVGTGLIRLGII